MHNLLQVVVATQKTGLSYIWERVNWNWLWTAVAIPLWKLAQRIYKWIVEMNTIKMQMPAIVEGVAKSNIALDKLVSLVAPNGGGSLSDKIDRIERRGIITQQLAWSLKEGSQDGEFITDENGQWTRANKTFLKMISASIDDCKGNGWIEYLTYSSRTETVEQYREAIEEKRGVDIDCVFKRDYVGTWHVLLSLQPMRNDGTIIGFTGTIKLKP